MRPATEAQDKRVFELYQAGIPPKQIMQELRLTKDEVYKGITRERRRRAGLPVYGRKRAK